MPTRPPCRPDEVDFKWWLQLTCGNTRIARVMTTSCRVLPDSGRRIKYRKCLSRITFQDDLLPSAWRIALEFDDKAIFAVQ